ncbi:MAG TPA: metal-sensing transcriptional repressor [Massilibacterium sp.]|nr:metal-sensing transcriptional repressor [Massilibacterium sp.]
MDKTNKKLDIELKPVKYVVRQEDEKKQLINRLKRIEGQVRGIQNMVETDRYCVDIMIQISAIRAALKKVELHLLKQHTNSCVADAVKNGEQNEILEELMKVIERVSK